MKLSHLSLAVVTAIALAACGGGNTNTVDNSTGSTPTPNSGSTTTPDNGTDNSSTDGSADNAGTDNAGTDNAGTDNAGTDNAGTDNAGTIDKGDRAGVNSNGLVSDYLPISVYSPDLANETTTSSHIYVRGIDSNFDEVANPDLVKNSSAISVAAITLDQSKSLQNYFGSREKAQPKDGVARSIVNYFGKLYGNEGTNVQEENALNIANIDELVQGAVNGEPVLALTGAGDEWATLATNTFADGTNGALRTAEEITAATNGENSKKDPNAFPSNTGGAHRAITQINGLVALNFGDDHAPLALGEDKDTYTTTRILGHYYRSNTNDNTVKYNSYQGAGVADDGILYAIPQKLNYVQFGRVTGDSAALSAEELQNPNLDYRFGEKKSLAPFARGWMSHNDGKSVSYYFYRGVEASTPEQVAAVSGGTLEYNGTALTYGIDNKRGDKTYVVPNALELKPKDLVGVGHFVTAKFDTAAKTVNGDIYNVWVEKNFDNDTYKRSDDVLIHFDGVVKGNTIVGDATNKKLGESDRAKGKFTGSFYGSDASEIGGAIDSIKEGYAAADWGAVFGAKYIAPPRKPEPEPAKPEPPKNDNYFFNEGNGVSARN